LKDNGEGCDFVGGSLTRPDQTRARTDGNPNGKKKNVKGTLRRSNGEGGKKERSTTSPSFEKRGRMARVCKSTGGREKGPRRIIG